MKIDNYKYTHSWDKKFNTELDSNKTLILVFASLESTLLKEQLKELKKSFPNSFILGASTAGEICQDEILDDTITVTIIKFENTKIEMVSKRVEDNESFKCGAETSKQLLADDLKSIFVLSDGLQVNGSQLTKGIDSIISKDIIVTGSLAFHSQY